MVVVVVVMVVVGGRCPEPDRIYKLLTEIPGEGELREPAILKVKL